MTFSYFVVFAPSHIFIVGRTLCAGCRFVRGAFFAYEEIKLNLSIFNQLDDLARNLIHQTQQNNQKTSFLTFYGIFWTLYGPMVRDKKPLFERKKYLTP